MVDFINKYILGIAVPVLLIGAGLYYTVILKAFHIRKLPKLFKILTSRRSIDGISPFRALTLALAGTLGVGNIVGVSAAICTGGFGAVFWMWISALCAMILKYAEVVLAMLHRRYDKNGVPHGSAMYYIKDYFSSRHLVGIGNTVAAVFAALCIANAVTMGGMIQSNAVSKAIEGVFGADGLICGVTISLICFVIIIKGSKTIAKLTEILVPMMSVGYLILSLAVIVIRKDILLQAFASIIQDAFGIDSAVGGILGFLTSRALRTGTMRGLISNEAGCGTAPMAHCSSSGAGAVEQGVFGILEVFIDTIVLCTMTALVVIINYEGINKSENWIMVTFEAYSKTLGSHSDKFLAIAVLCFGVATILCWGHYGIEASEYFSKNKYSRTAFTLIYCFAVMIGARVSSESVWSIADLAIGAMTVINVAILLMMKNEVKRETDIYFAHKNAKKKNFKKDQKK